MALNKSKQFPNRQQLIAGFSMAMQHPARVAILEALAEKGKTNCSEITEILPLAQPTVSQHLKNLVRSGLIHAEQKGRESLYSLNKEAVNEMQSLFYGLLNNLSNPLEI